MAQKCKKQRNKILPPQQPLDLEVLQRYQELREKEKFLDLEIKSFDEFGLTFTRKVHKYVINSLSVSLGRFFLDGNKIPCPGHVLDCIIEFAYSCKLNLGEDDQDANVHHLLEIASKFRIDTLKVELSQHIKSNLTLNTALESFKQASNYGLPSKDIHIIRTFILKNDFLGLNKLSNGFFNISNDVLESFIMDDNLSLKEEEVFNLIREWTTNDFPDREFLFKHVRYSQMSKDFRSTEVYNFFSENEAFSRKFGKLSMTSGKSKPRCPKEFVLAIGGWSSNVPDGPYEKIEAGANFHLTRPWRKMKFPLEQKRAGHGMGLINNVVYIFGGFSDEATEENYPKTTFAFDTTADKKVSYHFLERKNPRLMPNFIPFCTIIGTPMSELQYLLCTDVFF